MPVQAAKEEKKRLLGLAWPFTDFSLLLLELLFFTFASPWYRKEIEKPLKKEELSGHKSETNKKKRKEMKHQMRHKFDDDHFISLPFFPPVDFTCLFPWADENEAEGLIRQNINESREPSKARLTIKVLALQLDCCIAEAALAISFSAFHPESHSSPAPAVYYRDFCICCKDRCMLRIYTRRSLHVPVLFLLISLVCVFCAIQVALPCGV
jgi:Ca2+/Na+ antiporter